MLDLAAQGKVRCEIETRRLDQINEVFDQMRRAQITGRIVLKVRLKRRAGLFISARAAVRSGDFVGDREHHSR